jgi:hypothetical protein
MSRKIKLREYGGRPLDYWLTADNGEYGGRPLDYWLTADNGNSIGRLCQEKLV